MTRVARTVPMTATIAMTLALTGLLVGVAAAKPPQMDQRERTLRALLDAEIPALLADTQVPSVSIAHIERGRIVLTAAYGSQSPGVPATPATLYNIASMTKPISAEVVLRLASSGRVALDESMSAYWVDPDIAGDERHKRLTPRLSLSHQTGFPNWRRETGGVLSFRHAPGDAYGYSGEGFEYMARFAERKTGIAFETLAQTLIFDPAGMRDTAYTRRPWFSGRIAVPTTAEGKPLQPAIADTFFASDDVHATADDYARFLVGLMQGQGVSAAIADDRKRIQVSRKSEMCTAARRADCPRDVGFGLGWEVFAFDDETFLMHTGMDEGVFTFGYFSTRSKTATVIFTNSANGPRVVLPILDRLGKDRNFVRFLRRLAE